MEKREKKLFVLILLFLTLLIIGIIFFGYIDYLDKAILGFIRQYLTYDTITKIMSIVSIILTPIPMIAMFILFYIIVKDKYYTLLVCTSTFCSALLNIILKYIFRRDRPFEYMIENASGYSFPSAHSMVCIAFYGSILYGVNKLVKSKTMKNIYSAIFLSLIILTPMSRIYLGVHNFTDILMGVFAGYIILDSIKYVFDKGKSKKIV